MSYLRTQEHKALRAELIRRWKPWEKSTWPKSAEGKAKVSRNSYKGGWRDEIKALRVLLREQDEALKRVG